MTSLEAIFFWAAVGFYVFGFILYLFAVIFANEKYFPWALGLTTAGLVMNTATIAIRYSVVHHLPVKDTYEINLACAWVTMILFLALIRRYQAVKLSGIVVLPFAFIIMGFGFMTNPELAPLGPAYKSSWLVVHVLFAFISYACFAMAAGFAAVYLRRARYTADTLPDFFKRFPGGGALEDLAFKIVAFGFISNTVMLISGSLWAHDLWGAYWSWDPIETWSLMGWAVYGIYLHFRLTMGWKGRRLAWVNLAAFGFIILSFWGVPFLTPTWHNLNSITQPFPNQ